MKVNDDCLQLWEIVKFYWYIRVFQTHFCDLTGETQEDIHSRGTERETDFNDLAHQIILISKSLREGLMSGS